MNDIAIKVNDSYLTYYAIGLFIVALIIILFVFKSRSLWLSALLVIVGVAIMSLSFFIPTNQLNQSSNAIVKAVELKNKASNMKLIESNLPICNSDFHGSVNSVSWSDSKRSQLGLIIGERSDDKCIFKLKKVGE